MHVSRSKENDDDYDYVHDIVGVALVQFPMITMLMCLCFC